MKIDNMIKKMIKKPSIDVFGKNKKVMPWHGNIEKQTIQNNNYRKVIETGKHAQVVYMSLLPKQEIGNEVHPKVDQFFRIEKGKAHFVLNNGKDKYNEKNGGAVFVPANTWHNVINPSAKEKLKLYTIYSPKNHRAGLIQKDRPSRDMAYWQNPIEKSKILAKRDKLDDRAVENLAYANEKKETTWHNVGKAVGYQEALEDLHLSNDLQKKDRALPKECTSCAVEPGSGVSCTDCGHYSKRRKHYNPEAGEEQLDNGQFF